jgi:2,4-dienoyl-CoA reductase-like NADH-dependent reductase (Old Yellow Enzyme family)
MVVPNLTGDDGLVTSPVVEHYRSRSWDGAGIIIVEATAVQKKGRLAPYQLGLWSDEHIHGMAGLAQTIKEAEGLALVQLHHAGLATPVQVSSLCHGPSADSREPRSRELSPGEIESIRDAFIGSAYRAQKAGFDGVELHGAHGYLLNQFSSSYFNKRADEYGCSGQGRLKLAMSIIEGIRSLCGNDFIICYRLGANAPGLDDGIEISQQLEKAGVDLISASHGGILVNLPRPPRDFPFNWIVYCGTEIKKSVTIPVVVVNDIRTAERAAWLLNRQMADFVAIGRPLLADPEWVKHVRLNESVNECHSCKPRCRWHEDPNLCPAKKKLEKSIGLM